MKRIRGVLLGASLVAGLAAAGMASASLSYQTKGEMLKVWGKPEAGDVDALKAKLTPEVKTVVMSDISNGNWELGRDLGEVIEKAKVTTVVHGACTGWVCSMMFLSGEQRLFSGEGRPEVHRLEIPFIEGRTSYLWNGVKETLISEWLDKHSKLSSDDVRIYRKSMFRASTDNITVDFLEFFPQAARVSGGSVLHCSGEIMAEKKKEHTLKDCMPVGGGVTALNRGIVTSAEPYTSPALKVKADIKPPAPTEFAKLAEPIPDAIGLSDDCKAAYQRFQNYDAPRAFVVSDDSYCAWSSAQSFTPYEGAMAACKRLSKTGRCRFYAVDNQVVFSSFGPPVVMNPTAAGKPQE